MSGPAIAFSIYFGIGLLLMIVAIVSAGNEKRTKALEAAGGVDPVDAALLIFIALLWPIWLVSLLGKKDQKGPTSYDS